MRQLRHFGVYIKESGRRWQQQNINIKWWNDTNESGGYSSFQTKTSVYPQSREASLNNHEWNQEIMYLEFMYFGFSLFSVFFRNFIANVLANFSRMTGGARHRRMYVDADADGKRQTPNNRDIFGCSRQGFIFVGIPLRSTGGDMSIRVNKKPILNKTEWTGLDLNGLNSKTSVKTRSPFVLEWNLGVSI